MSSDDLQYGLPLLKAWWTLSSEEMINRALLASEGRKSAGSASFVPGNPWRYERFSYPKEMEPEAWASWHSQKADPLIAAEATRQNFWFSTSLALGDRLRDGTIIGFGRKGDVAGDWVAIPAAAWSSLRVPFDYTFSGWRLGHLQGGGSEFWEVRLRDAVGLPMRCALLAYGSNAASGLVQRHRAYSQLLPSRLPRETKTKGEASAFSARMADYGSHDDQEDLTPARVEQAESELGKELVARLKEGSLIASGVRPDGTKSRLSREDWIRGKVDFEQSSVATHSMRFTQVLIRPSASSAIEMTQCTDQAREWSSEDVDAWWRTRLAQFPSERWPFSEADDHEAAKALFAGYGRDEIRELRKGIAGRVQRGRRSRTGNLP